MTMLALALATALAAPDDLATRFVQAWDASDAQALSALFAPDADLITPDGRMVSGPAHIDAFYTYVFAHGYRGVPATAEILSVRVLAPGLDIVDARWTIGDKEKGIMAAVLEKTDAGWRIRALRENRGATGLSAFSP